MKTGASLTNAGWSVLLLAALSYLVGWYFGWIELIVVFAGCLFAMCIAALFLLRRAHLEADRVVEPARVPVGDTALGSLTIQNVGSRVTPALSAVDTIAGDPVEIRLPPLAPNERIERTYALPTERRGVVELGPVEISITDPLHLFERTSVSHDQARLYVHPPVVRVLPSSIGTNRDFEGPTSDSSPQGSIAFHTLREYVRGDDLRHIHWRSTARTNKLMVRHYVDNRRPHVVALLNRNSDNLSRQQFDTAASVVASLCVSAAGADFPASAFAVGFDLGGPLAGRAPAGLLDRLAEIDLAGGDEQLSFAKLTALALTEREATHFVLITGPTQAEELMPHVRRLQGQAHVTVVRIFDHEPEIQGFLPGTTVIDTASLAGFATRWNHRVGVYAAR